MATTKFLLLFRVSTESQQTKPSPEYVQQQYKAWATWKAKFEKEIVDTGDGLNPYGGAAVYKAGTVTDGPYIESKEVMGGYTFVATDSLARAVEIARECPINMEPGASVEIRELANYGSR